VGLELGQALKRMGLRVTGVDRLAHIGGLTDPEVNRVAVEIFEEEMPLWLGAEAGVEEAGGRLKISAGDSGGFAETALLSIGRTPNVDRLRLERLGVEPGDRGVPPFDRHTLQVGDLPVFIAGDVTGGRPVLHEAAHEGTVAGYNAVHDPVVGFKRKAPLAICFSDPNICVVGASYEELKDADPAIGAARFDGGREKVMLRSGGLIRIYAERLTGRLLGAEMVAPDGEHLAHLLAWSIQQDMTAAGLLAMPYYHPTVEETLKGALADLLDEVAGSEFDPLPGFEAKDPQ
jgi:dihydrolipoamide dehydrogenase